MELSELRTKEDVADYSDAVTEAMGRKPDGREWSVAVSSFLMGASCAAHALKAAEEMKPASRSRSKRKP